MKPGSPSSLTIRTGLKPGDLGMIVHLHGRIYADEYGLDASFEPYVAGPLAEFARAGATAGEIWIAERDGAIVGCIAALIDHSALLGQIRWFLVTPAARGMGLGRRLLDHAMCHFRQQGCRSAYLLSFDDLDAAIALYRRAGFEVTSRTTLPLWGGLRNELRMDIRFDTLAAPPQA